jgi:hypothetical protein
MPRYTIEICPNEISDNSLEYTSGQSIKSQRIDEIGMTFVVVPICPVGSICTSGQKTVVKLCPIGETCGCNYDTTIQWIGLDQDRVVVKWDNPNKCILEKIELKAKTVWGESWNTIMKYIHTKNSDPDIVLYPDGDDRNADYCRGCGIGGEGKHPPGTEEFWDIGKIIPGMMYRVDGYFRNTSCGGVTQPVPIGYSLYETPALTSGVITQVYNEIPPRYQVSLYSNIVDDYPLTIQLNMLSVDYYPWSVGDSVMILKDQKSYPGGDPIIDRPNQIGGPAYVRFNSGNTQRDEDALIISAYEVLEGFYGYV